MTLFVALAALLAAVALAFVLPPLLRGAKPAAGAVREEVNSLIYREQLAELRAERERGALDEDQFQRAVRELERRIVAESGATGAESPRSPHALAAVVVALAVPVVAGLGYWRLGAPEALVRGDATHAAGSMAQPGDGELNAMVEKLWDRLQKSPDDPDGWALLGRSASALGRHDRAVQAFARAAQLLPDDANVLADYADALAVTRGRRLEGEPMVLARRALAADPQHLKALALVGAGEFQAGNHAAAAGYWRKALATVPPESEFARQLQGSLEEAEKLAAAGGTPAPAAKAPAKKPMETLAAVNGTVSLDPKLAAAASPGDIVFVIARPADGGRMPLAVARTTVAALPYRFTLDDSMAMAPGMTLSSHAKVVVAARISKSGNPIAQKGDLEGASAPVASTASGLSIVISRVVE
ncbi:MAG: c-type cytochrome biogenesis protein CcmI [Betaproteobacteria bacterium]